jgi:hypothetical protein
MSFMSLWKSPIQARQTPGVIGYDMSDFEVGDRLRTLHSYWHEGIYVGPRGANGESIVHNDFREKKVILSHPEDYTRKGRPIQLVERVPEERREEVARRALGMLGTPFDLARYNCQHFTHHVQHGAPDSPRIRKITASLGFVFMIAAITALIVGGGGKKLEEDHEV